MAEPTLLPVTRLVEGGLPPTVLVCGDPARAERIAARFDDVHLVARNREYHTYSGTYRDCPVAVASHGIGAAGAAICFEELIRAGARVLLRVGTCGTFRDDLEAGDFLIPTAAAREDGLTDRLVPDGFPAVADGSLATALADAAAEAGQRFASGIVLSNDAFYGGVLPPIQPMYAACGVLGVEMECSALFVIAALRGARAAAILTIDGHPLRRRDDASEYQPHRDVVYAALERAIDVALNVLSGAPAQAARR
jgi:uridine phosphorylase